jgi:hypothetical protein
VLDVPAVQARYRLADPRAARTVMHEAGGFHVGGRLYSRVEDLRRLEADRVRREVPPPTPQTARPRCRTSQKPAKLERGFWRE